MSVSSRMQKLLEAGSVTEATDAEKLEIAKKAFREIIRGCEYRLRKGSDYGDQQSLNISKDALKALA